MERFLGREKNRQTTFAVADFDEDGYAENIANC